MNKKVFHTLEYDKIIQNKIFFVYFLQKKGKQCVMIENTEFYLEYLPINFSVIAQDKSILPPYLGSTLRGAIGHVLRNDTIYMITDVWIRKEKKF